MSPQLTPRAKSIVAAVAAVVLTGITAWQAMTAGGFRWLDIVPVVAAVLGAVQTDLIPNTAAQPVAKAIVHGGFAVASAAAAVIAADPTGVTAAKLLTVGAGALLVWFTPELDTKAGPLLAAVAPLAQPIAVQAAAGHLDARDILAALAELDAQATPIADAAQAAATAAIPVQRDTLPPVPPTTAAIPTAPAPA